MFVAECEYPVISIVPDTIIEAAADQARAWIMHDAGDEQIRDICHEVAEGIRNHISEEIVEQVVGDVLAAYADEIENAAI